MSELFVMRRANGEFFTETVDGRPYLHVWPSRFILEKYKVFNPALDLFLPKLVDSRLLPRLRSLAASGYQFLLMSADTPAPDMDDGRPLTMAEIEQALSVAA